MAKSKFREIYESLPARAGKAPKTVWIEHLAKITMKSEQTVRCWVYGTQKLMSYSILNQMQHRL